MLFGPNSKEIGLTFTLVVCASACAGAVKSQFKRNWAYIYTADLYNQVVRAYRSQLKRNWAYIYTLLRACTCPASLRPNSKEIGLTFTLDYLRRTSAFLRVPIQKKLGLHLHCIRLFSCQITYLSSQSRAVSALAAFAAFLRALPSISFLSFAVLSAASGLGGGSMD